MTMTMKQTVRPRMQTTLFDIHVAPKTAIQKLYYFYNKTMKKETNTQQFDSDYTHNNYHPHFPPCLLLFSLFQLTSLPP